MLEVGARLHVVLVGRNVELATEECKAPRGYVGRELSTVSLEVIAVSVYEYSMVSRVIKRENRRYLLRLHG